jgi:hypothetical protein
MLNATCGNRMHVGGSLVIGPDSNAGVDRYRLYVTAGGSLGVTRIAPDGTERVFLDLNDVAALMETFIVNTDVSVDVAFALGYSIDAVELTDYQMKRGVTYTFRSGADELEAVFRDAASGVISPPPIPVSSALDGSTRTLAVTVDEGAAGFSTINTIHIRFPAHPGRGEFRVYSAAAA